MKEFIRLQQPNGSKRLWESEDLQNTNLSVCESKKLRNLWVNMYEIRVTHDASKSIFHTIKPLISLII